MNLELKHKFYKILDKTFSKKYKNKIKLIIQPNPSPNILSSIELEEIVGSIGLEFSQAEHVELLEKIVKPNSCHPTDVHP